LANTRAPHVLHRNIIRKNVSHDEIMDITDCLDENSETIIEAMLGKAKTVHNDDNNKSNQQLEILKDIERIRSRNNNMIGEEWHNRLVGLPIREHHPR
jgi:hypothetical protein